jgi:hypothetical protein
MAPDSPHQSELDDVALRWMGAMRRGGFEEAWRQTDRIELPRRVLEASNAFVRQPQHLKWNGESFDGRDVLVRCEHGLGDTLQFIRYVPIVRKRARSVTVLVQPALLSLFAGSDDFGSVRNGWSAEPPPPHEVEIEVMEFPYALRSTVETVPRTVPYLPLTTIKERASRLPPMAERDGLRVGLLWAASEWDESRSIPLPLLEPLARVPHVRFYSLQQGEHAARAAEAPFEIEPYSRHTSDITAAAAAMLELDLIVTVDAMAAHLAGALARPVWVLLQNVADWRWMCDRSDSPWYPTMRLFRQPQQGDWRAVVEQAAAALSPLVNSRC